jgi:hypothetical protein
MHKSKTSVIPLLALIAATLGRRHPGSSKPETLKPET